MPAADLRLSAQVDLDLSPHTTLAKAGRDYAHNCFMLPGVKLTPGYHVGVSGLASGYTEPDSIDVYAVSSPLFPATRSRAHRSRTRQMDVFEIIKEVRSLSLWHPELLLIPYISQTEGKVAAEAGTDDAPEIKESAPLEGTSEDAVSSLRAFFAKRMFADLFLDSRQPSRTRFSSPSPRWSRPSTRSHAGSTSSAGWSGHCSTTDRQSRTATLPLRQWGHSSPSELHRAAALLPR